MDKKRCGIFITNLRLEKKLTQEDLAQLLYVDRSVISKWESGKNIPTPEMLLTLSRFFDVSVNEILLGEKSTKENEQQINEVTVTVIKDSQKKLKRILLLSFISIFLLLLAFFIYYFVNTYNSVKVYKIIGESDHFYVNDGVMIFSNEKSYISISKIRAIGTNEAYKYTLYYLKGEEKFILMERGVNNPMLFTNDFDSDKLYFPKEDLEYVKNSLYLEIDTTAPECDDEGFEIIYLKLKEDFSNSNIIFP